jgi:hypothetical protein
VVKVIFSDQKLGEIATRLRLLCNQNKTEMDEQNKLASDEPPPHEALNVTIRDLTAALNRLVDVLMKTGRENR